MASFCLFSSSPHATIIIKFNTIIDGVLGARTQGGRMEGSDEYTELWRHPNYKKNLHRNWGDKISSRALLLKSMHKGSVALTSFDVCLVAMLGALY